MLTSETVDAESTATGTFQRPQTAKDMALKIVQILNDSSKPIHRKTLLDQIGGCGNKFRAAMKYALDKKLIIEVGQRKGRGWPMWTPERAKKAGMVKISANPKALAAQAARRARLGISNVTTNGTKLDASFKQATAGLVQSAASSLVEAFRPPNPATFNPNALNDIMARWPLSDHQRMVLVASGKIHEGLRLKMEGERLAEEGYIEYAQLIGSVSIKQKVRTAPNTNRVVNGIKLPKIEIINVSEPVRLGASPKRSSLNSKGRRPTNWMPGNYVDVSTKLDDVENAVKKAKGWANLRVLETTSGLSIKPLKRTLKLLIENRRIKIVSKKHNPIHKQPKNFNKLANYYVVV